MSCRSLVRCHEHYVDLFSCMSKKSQHQSIFPSHVSGRGYKIGPVSVCVRLSALLRLNRLSYRQRDILTSFDDISGPFGLLNKGAVKIYGWGVGLARFRKSRAPEFCPPSKRTHKNFAPPLQVRALKFRPPPQTYTYEHSIDYINCVRGHDFW